MPDTLPTRARRLRLRLLGAAGVLILFAGWAVASLAAGSFFVPAPWTTIADTALLLARGATWTQILITFLRVCVGFLAGFAVGLWRESQSAAAQRWQPSSARWCCSSRACRRSSGPFHWWRSWASGTCRRSW